MLTPKGHRADGSAPSPTPELRVGFQTARRAGSLWQHCLSLRSVRLLPSTVPVRSGSPSVVSAASLESILSLSSCSDSSEG